MQLSEQDKKEICRDFIRNIARIRDKMGLSQREFGHLVGVSKERINAIENERATLKWSLYCSILFLCFLNFDSKQYVLHNHMIDPRTFRFLQFRGEKDIPLLNIYAEEAGHYQQWLHNASELEK